MELVEHVDHAGELLVLPVLVFLSPFGKLVQLFLLCGPSGLLGQQLEELRGRWVGDVQVVRQGFTYGHWDRHPLLLHPHLLSMGGTSSLHINGFIWVNGGVEVRYELVDHFGVVLGVDGYVVTSFVTNLVAVSAQHN